MLQINGTGINVNQATAIYGISGGNNTIINKAGTSGGTVTGYQNTLFNRTEVVLNFNNYVNSTATNQSISFPYAFTQTPTVGTNDTGLVISATTTGLTITSPDSATQYSGNVLIFGI
jgi:hypothetical protein